MAGMKEKGKGLECYEWYHYLWHLIAIGAVKRRKVDNVRMTPESVGYVLEADAWAALDTDYPGEGVVVAQIDTGVNDRHPNIEPRICDPVSFAAHPFGLRYPKREPDTGPDGNEDQPRLIRGAQPGLGSSLIGADTWNKAERLAAKDPVAAELIGRS